VMPGQLSGLDLATVVRQRHPRVRIVCTTGFSSALDAGTPVLSKPYDARTLRREIEHALAETPRRRTLSTQL
jgi:ActR/RegA family two-component response regulator